MKKQEIVLSFTEHQLDILVAMASKLDMTVEEWLTYNAYQSMEMFLDEVDEDAEMVDMRDCDCLSDCDCDCEDDDCECGCRREYDESKEGEEDLEEKILQ